MNSSPSPAAAEPHNAATATADERLKRAYQQIASADEQLAHVNEKISRLEREAGPRTSAGSGRRRRGAGAALRGFVGLVLAAGIVGTALVSQTPSGEATRQMVARWVFPGLAQSVRPERARSETAPGPVEVAAAETTALPAIAPAPQPPQDAAPAPAPLPPELAQQLQTLTTQIVNLDQKIEQLRAAQEQMVIQMTSNSARAIAEFKSGQEQVMRLMAKTPEPNARPKGSSSSSAASAASSSASPTRAAAVTAHQPASAHVSPQGRSQPAAAARTAEPAQ
jgi:phage shock protein A